MLGPMNRFHLDISALPEQAEPIRWGVPAWQGLWRGSPLIKIYDVNGWRIAIIPINFLAHRSVSEAWQQIITIIGCCVRSQGGRLYQQVGVSRQSTSRYGLYPVTTSSVLKVHRLLVNATR
jgi:hypothetical protein